MRNILITGGSKGIGAEAVRHFKRANDNVVFIYNKSKAEAENLMKETNSIGIKCDLSNEKEINGIAKDILVLLNNRVDVLITNAGIASYGLIAEMDTDTWRNTIDTNINGTYYIIKAIIPNMIYNKKGSIITISSVWGQVGAACEVAYSTAKAGIIGMTKALAKEVAPSNIRVNCISPGFINTDMNNRLSEEEVQAFIDTVPQGVAGEKQNVVDAMEFLASDKSSYITGQIIGVNGGLVI
jgi:3-oxoacyl-[acyl-carrier protein] reductase